jgi:hypothetical protein
MLVQIHLQVNSRQVVELYVHFFLNDGERKKFEVYVYKKVSRD